METLRMAIALAACVALRAAGAAEPDYSCRFERTWSECGFTEQAKAEQRAAMVTAAGIRGVRLRTEPGDRGVAGSGGAERADLALSVEATGCAEGAEQWWAHSILFPADYVAPATTRAIPWAWGVVFNFHHTGSVGQANFQLEILPDPVGLQFSISAGAQPSSGAPDSATRRWPIGPVARNAWYHFVYHVKWSSGEGGFFDAWVNGERRLEYRGPTLYAGQRCYLKLANYHTPVGKPVSVVHSRVLRGATREALIALP